MKYSLPPFNEKEPRELFEEKIIDFSSKLFSNKIIGIFIILILNALYIFLYFKNKIALSIFLYLFLICISIPILLSSNK